MLNFGRNIQISTVIISMNLETSDSRKSDFWFCQLLAIVELSDLIIIFSNNNFLYNSNMILVLIFCIAEKVSDRGIDC